MTEYKPEDQAFNAGAITTKEWLEYRAFSEKSILTEEDMARRQELADKIAGRKPADALRYDESLDSNPRLIQLSNIHGMIERGEMTPEKARLIQSQLGRES